MICSVVVYVDLLRKKHWLRVYEVEWEKPRHRYVLWHDQYE